MVSVTGGANGPVGAIEKPPLGDAGETVTVIVDCAACAAPVAFRSASVIGPDTAPAAMVCGALLNASSGCVHVRNDCQRFVKEPPGYSPPQVLVQASTPGSAGFETAAESRIAAASLSRIRPDCEAKSPDERPTLRGAQAKPQ